MRILKEKMKETKLQLRYGEFSERNMDDKEQR